MCFNIAIKQWYFWTNRNWSLVKYSQTSLQQLSLQWVLHHPTNTVELHYNDSHYSEFYTIRQIQSNFITTTVITVSFTPSDKYSRTSLQRQSLQWVLHHPTNTVRLRYNNYHYSEFYTIRQIKWDLVTSQYSEFYTIRLIQSNFITTTVITVSFTPSDK